MDGLNEAIAVLTIISLACGLPFIKPLFKMWQQHKQDRLTKLIDEANQPLIDTYHEQHVALQAELDALKSAEVADLHNKLDVLGNNLLTKQSITIDELNNFDYLYNSYRKLGGNGTGEVIAIHVHNLPIKETAGKSFVEEAQELHEEREHE